MLEQRLRSRAEQNPDAPAMRVKRDGVYREWSNAQTWSLARSVAAELRHLDVAPGERVGLFAENSPEWILAYLGIYLAGAVVVPLDAQYTERELATVAGFAGCRVMLCDEHTRPRAESVRAEAQIQELLSIAPDAPIFSAPPLESPARRRPDELMTVIFTSGTTGDPKGVCLSVGNITSNVQSCLDIGILQPQDALLCLLPLHHGYALTAAALVPLSGRGSITFCSSLRVPHILQTMRDTDVSVVMAVPKLFEGFDHAIRNKRARAAPWKQLLFAVCARFSAAVRRITGWNPGRLLFPSVHRMFGTRFRFFVSGGAKLDPAVANRLLDLGVTVVEGYGLTETSPVITFNPVKDPRVGSAGLPIPGVEIKIADPDDQNVGEVLVRGPNVMQGYDRRPEDTAKVLRDGWLHTGDLGFIDADGYLHITGRAKDVIVLASGKNIYPEDVERHYEQSPLIGEICVMPIEQADGRVNRLRALLVPALDELQRRKIADSHQAIRRELASLAHGLAAHIHLADVKLVTNPLPRTRIGKLRRMEIRRMDFDEIGERVPDA